jgi:hypothetical protein
MEKYDESIDVKNDEKHEQGPKDDERHEKHATANVINYNNSQFFIK